MKTTLLELLTSKRFLVTTLAVLVCAAFVVAGRMPLEDFLDVFTKLAALLATLYGLENAASALRSTPSPASTTTVNVAHAGATLGTSSSPPPGAMPPPLPDVVAKKAIATGDAP